MSKIPASAGNVPDWCASIRPGMRSVRSLGAITATSGLSRSKTCRQAHRRHDHTQSLSLHPGLAAQHQLGVRSLRPALGRSARTAVGFPGWRPSPHRGDRQAPTNRLSGIMINTVGDHRYGLRVVGSQFRDRTVGCGTDLFRASLRPCTTSTTGDPRLAAILALNDSSVPVATSV